MGGELTVNRTRHGRLQLRRTPPGRMTKAAEQAFFAALSATANVRLSAAAAGFTHASIYARARKSRAFKREMRLALETGYTRIEAAAFQAALPQSHADDAWRHNDPPPIPPMSVDQAMQLLFLHEKSVRQGWERPHRRRRRGESEETYVERLRAMWTAEKAREAEDATVRLAAQEGTNDDWELNDPPPLPALEQVTGWSKAKPHGSSEAGSETANARPAGRAANPSDDSGFTPESGRVFNPQKALFGGWRLADWEKKQRKS